MRGRVLTATLTALVLVPTGPAVAGGWWGSIQVDGHVLGVGEVVPVSAHVMFDSLADAEHARENGGYHAYLIEGFDRSVLDAAMSSGDRHGWWEPPARAIHLGEVTFHAWDANLAVATAGIEVPDVPQGLYDVMFCTLDCAEPLADLIPTLDVRVFADAMDAQLARNVAGLTEELHTVSAELRDRVDQVGGDVRGLGADVRALASETETIAGSLEASAATAATATTGPSDVRSPAWLTAGGWFLAGALASWALAGRSRRRAASGPVPAEAPSSAEEPALPPPEFVTHL